MTQSTNLKLDLLSATDLFDTDKIKSNFEKIDNTVLIPTKIIDNCVTDNSLLPLSAKQGKLLQDQITKLNGDLALQTQTLYKNVVIYRIGNIAMLSAPSWVRKEDLAELTIPTGYRPVKNISIPFTQQNFNDGAYCDVSTEGKINYTGTSHILINAVWFCA